MKIIKIKNCGNCNFRGNSPDGMQCNHPYWEDKDPYANLIISQDNLRNQPPKECPLRKEDLNVNITYKL